MWEKYCLKYYSKSDNVNIKLIGFYTLFLSIKPDFFVVLIVEIHLSPVTKKTVTGGKMKSLPKRRKYKDNPYKIEQLNENKYSVTFKDNKNTTHIVHISQEIYMALNEFDRHIEHFDLCEEAINKRAVNKQKSIEENVEELLEHEKLKEAINKLSPIQKRRLKMYYFEDMTLDEIALVEKCSHQAVSKSIKKSIEELKKILKN